MKKSTISRAQSRLGEHLIREMIRIERLRHQLHSLPESPRNDAGLHEAEVVSQEQQMRLLQYRVKEMLLTRDLKKLGQRKLAASDGCGGRQNVAAVT